MSPAAAERPPLEKLLGIAEYHREHERFYSSEGLRHATTLRQDAEALKRLADRWLDREAAEGQAESDATFQVMGSPDLNDWAAIATSGILFMEGEGEPAEIGRLRERLRGLAAEFERYAQWLGEKMEAAWPREASLLTPELIDLAYSRHIVLMRTTLHGEKVAVAGRLIAAAERALSAGQFDPKTIRGRREQMANLVHTAGLMLDAAASVLAEQAAQLALADPDWTRYIEGLKTRIADGGGATSSRRDGQTQAARGNGRRRRSGARTRARAR